MTEVERLSSLARQARFEMECLGYPARSWVLPRSRDGENVLDALIIGGGQSGISIAFRLLREQVSNVRVLDKSPAGLEGPWSTFARMHSLRTPKHVTGPDLGIPSLTAQAWFEAKFGKQSWRELEKIPRAGWHSYLNWLRDVTGIEVTNHADVCDIEPLDNGLLAVHADVGGDRATLYARNVVLATGIEGAGNWSIPELVKRSLPSHLYAHTSDSVDFKRLSGKKIVVIGAGASAFDNAATALEHGAASVELLVRRKALPVINPNRWMEFSGFLRHYADLDDARKWAFMKTIFDMNQPPPQETFDRCARFPSFSLQLGVTPENISMEDEKVSIMIDGETRHFDFLIAGTGFSVDLAGRKEIAGFADKIALWSDRHVPAPGEESGVLSAYPYLSANFQFTEKVMGTAPFLQNIFCYTFAAMPSLACSAGISALKFGVERVAAGISRMLFLEDADAYLASLRAYNEVELDMRGLGNEISGSGKRVA